MVLLGSFYRLCDRIRNRRRAGSENESHALGKRGEDLAHRLLQRKGYIVLERNYRTPSGYAEIDLIAVDKEVIVFVEVKTRSTEEYGTAESAVDRRKQRKIIIASELWLRRLPQTPEPLVRYDIVSVVMADQPKVEHLPDAFSRGIAEAHAPRVAWQRA